MFEGDSADMCTGKSPIMSMGGRVEGLSFSAWGEIVFVYLLISIVSALFDWTVQTSLPIPPFSNIFSGIILKSMRNEENSKHTISSHSTPFLICIHNSHISAKCSFTNSYSSLSKNRDVGRKLYLNVCHHFSPSNKTKTHFFLLWIWSGWDFHICFYCWSDSKEKPWMNNKNVHKFV